MSTDSRAILYETFIVKTNYNKIRYSFYFSPACVIIFTLSR